MQFSNVFLAALAAATVSAQYGASPAYPSMGGASSGGVSASNSSGSAAGTGGSSTSGSPAQVTANGAPSSLAHGGGLVSVAGLSVVFALFM